MRRTASEVLRELEMRVARLEDKTAHFGPSVYIDSMSPLNRDESNALEAVQKKLESMRLNLPRGLTYEMINEAHLKMSPKGQEGPFYRVAVEMAGSDEDEFGRPSYDGVFFVIVDSKGRVKSVVK